MKKTLTEFVCSSCGYTSPKWLGKCPGCSEWNSLMEENKTNKQTDTVLWSDKILQKERPINIKKIVSSKIDRIITKDKELNRVLGGGIVPGSVVLIGGEPGIGKSTLMLQITLSLKMEKSLYVSGEESKEQIKIRSERLGEKHDNCFVLTETNLENILTILKKSNPDILIIDSIQTMKKQTIDATPGSISQIRECAHELMIYAKKNSIPVFLIGHITKDGIIAGPKVLEHMVDTVIIFEGDRHLSYRIIRAQKNRFGPTNELGIYEMNSKGLRQVSNPSEILISQKDASLSGVSIGSVMEGNRTLLFEIQALVCTSNYSTPQRSSTGFNLKRLNMLIAVLEKRGGLKVNNQDVFINIAGGINIDDPSADLALCFAIISSYKEVAISNKMCFCGEVGLNGEIRSIGKIESRIAEAEKLGFSEIIISKYNTEYIEKKNYSIKISGFEKLSDAYSYVIKKP